MRAGDGGEEGGGGGGSPGAASGRPTGPEGLLENEGACAHQDGGCVTFVRAERGREIQAQGLSRQPGCRGHPSTRRHRSEQAALLSRSECLLLLRLNCGPQGWACGSPRGGHAETPGVDITASRPQMKKQLCPAFNHAICSKQVVWEAV